MSERVVIIGGSHAANSVIETLRWEDFRGRLTLISEEKVPLLSPTALPYLLENRNWKDPWLRPLSFYQDIQVVETRAIGIEPDRGRVVLPGRKRISYDRLVIATGASAAPLTIETSRENPVLTLRKVQDLHRIAEKARRSQKILIIGAGLIGLHLAQIFSQAKKKVHVIELKDQVLPGLIPSGLAFQVKSLFEEKGVRISLGVRLETLREKEGRLSNGERVGVDLAIAAIGIRTNWEVVQGTSIAVREGIVVNDRMETSLPGIYACGDVAEYRDFFTGESRLNPNLVSAAEQGRTVAAALLGKSDRHPGLISINTFRCFGCELVSLGRIEADVGDHVLEQGDFEGKFYKRMIFRDGRLKGLSFFNIPIDGGLYYKLVREGVSLEREEERLFREPFLFGKALAQRASKA